MTMTTDDKLGAHLEEYLRVHEHTHAHLKKCLKEYSHIGACSCSRATFLATISDIELSDEVLIVTEQFLDGLPFEEAQKYINKQDENNYSILFFAGVPMLKIIIKYVLDINVKNILGNTALVRVCAVMKSQPKENIDTIKFLLDNGSNVNIATNNGGTALMYFCYQISCFQSEDVEMILETFVCCGANVHLMDRNNRTAFDFVKDKSWLSMQSSQLLQGSIRMNRTKRAV